MLELTPSAPAKSLWPQDDGATMRTSARVGFEPGLTSAGSGPRGSRRGLELRAVARPMRRVLLLLPTAVLLRARWLLRLPSPTLSDGSDSHPERLAVQPHIEGLCLEIGCGHRKSDPSIIGLDLIPGGSTGRVGNVSGRVSAADLGADGSRLPFTNQVFDSIIARHNLEHYVDTLGTLREWRRVLEPGGRVAVVVPDEETFPDRTVDLDPTHYHCFTQESLAALMEVAGFATLLSRPVIPRWSFLLVAERA